MEQRSGILKTKNFKYYSIKLTYGPEVVDTPNDSDEAVDIKLA